MIQKERARSSSKKLVELQGRKGAIISTILDSRSSKSFLVKSKVGKRTIALLLDFTQAEEIYFTRGSYALCGFRFKRALEDVGIKVGIIDIPRGRKTKVSREDFLSVYSVPNVSDRKKAKMLGVSPRTFYYLKARYCD